MEYSSIDSTPYRDRSAWSKLHRHVAKPCNQGLDGPSQSRTGRSNILSYTGNIHLRSDLTPQHHGLLHIGSLSNSTTSQR